MTEEHQWTALGAHTNENGHHMVSYQCARCLQQIKRPSGSHPVLEGGCQLEVAPEPKFWVQSLEWERGMIKLEIMARLDADLAGRQFMHRLNEVSSMHDPARLRVVIEEKGER